MYKSALLITGLLMAFFTHAQQGDLLVHAPNVQKRDVGSFHGISVSSSIDLVVKQGNEEGVAVSASDPALRDRIVTSVENGILHIYLKDNGFHWNWGWNNQHLKAFVSFKTLNQLSASGSSDIYVDGSINTDNLSISLSGSSDFKGAVHTNQLQLQQSGSSDANISGTAGTASIHLNGSSDVKAYDLSVDVCTISAHGSSDTHITVNKELSVYNSGSSDVNYKGNAVVKEFHSSGSSEINKKSS
ncbi:head GIN domain-containing protein [Dinghuibacter silviterrae]|uniref:Putative autotransporter adhesin-like protein n=1 Tax=Dinghuibacter silviterrae TaxID=1539049 RepID=A0A4R8DRV3_9BACT|nr:head GIN domain-containing protein [Dinghuibacter silviterrae]TDX00719.1 putative autotransporter adhesin-like protein [Dinghuibacter silviterrae]